MQRSATAARGRARKRLGGCPRRAGTFYAVVASCGRRIFAWHHHKADASGRCRRAGPAPASAPRARRPAPRGGGRARPPQIGAGASHVQEGNRRKSSTSGAASTSSSPKGRTRRRRPSSTIMERAASVPDLGLAAAAVPQPYKSRTRRGGATSATGPILLRSSLDCRTPTRTLCWSGPSRPNDFI